ncbi:MAG: GNAT family N-acetyltransferase [Lachnospiraceae bacterium]|nr:GNAT family N-acetyltransferase [Lachnospiraceae bacterium]
MKLRPLELKDAPLMVEWMQDSDIYSKMAYDAKDISVLNAEKFIEASKDRNENVHLAIASENDEYLGTVSLKNIDQKNSNAEFAIAIRKCAMGQGISKYAMIEILRVAFEELLLNKVYLYVRVDNERAIRFYEKCHLREEGVFKKHLKIGDEYYDLKWYGMLRSEYTKWLESVKEI